MSDRIILPQNLIPHHYNLSLTDLDFESWTYKGIVRRKKKAGVSTIAFPNSTDPIASIDLDITQNTNHIVLNATVIKLIDSRLHIGNGDEKQAIQSSGSSLQNEADILTIFFHQDLTNSQQCKLDIEFKDMIKYALYWILQRTIQVHH